LLLVAGFRVFFAVQIFFSWWPEYAPPLTAEAASLIGQEIF
jgi:hypothetical protein